MADSHQPPPRFSLAALFELLTGIALLLALVTQLGCLGAWMAFLGLAIIAYAHRVVFWKADPLVKVSWWVVTLLFTLALWAESPRLAESLSPPNGQQVRAGFWVLLAAETVFVSMAIFRRVRTGRQIRGEVPHG